MEIKREIKITWIIIEGWCPPWGLLPLEGREDSTQPGHFYNTSSLKGISRSYFMVPSTYQGWPEVLFQSQKWVACHCQCLHCETRPNRNLKLDFPLPASEFSPWLISRQAALGKLSCWSINSCEGRGLWSDNFLMSISCQLPFWP